MNRARINTCKPDVVYLHPFKNHFKKGNNFAAVWQGYSVLKDRKPFFFHMLNIHKKMKNLISEVFKIMLPWVFWLQHLQLKRKINLYDILQTYIYTVYEHLEVSHKALASIFYMQTQTPWISTYSLHVFFGWERQMLFNFAVILH